MRKLLFAICFLFSINAMAQVEGPKNLSVDLGALISSQTMAAARSFTSAVVKGYGLLTLYVYLVDADNSVTALGIACYARRTGVHGVQDYTFQEVTVAAGVGTMVDASLNKNPSAITSPKKYPIRLDVEGFQTIKCTFTPTGGASADVLTVEGVASVKGG